jgi:hypothetical protein
MNQCTSTCPWHDLLRNFEGLHQSISEAVIQARKNAGLIGEIVFPDGNVIPLQNRETTTYYSYISRSVH